MSGAKVVGGLTVATFLLAGGCTAVMGAGGAGLADQATGCAPAGPAIVQAGATTGPATPPPAAPGAGDGAGEGKLPATVGIYSGVQLVNAGHVIKAGQSLGLDAWTITVGVMTTMGESGLRVLDRGDAAGPDSRGLWQQRAGGAWGTLADRMDPTISSVNGFTALIAVPGYRNLAPTVAAHRAQGNSAENYYAPFWPDAVEVVAALTKDPSLLDSLPATGGNLTPASGADCPAVDPASAGGGSGGGQAISGKWANPLKPAKYTLTSDFGDYRPFLPTAKLHKGQDLAAPGGTPCSRMNGTGSIGTPSSSTCSCRWSPVELPVVPTFPICSPAVTCAPDCVVMTDWCISLIVIPPPQSRVVWFPPPPLTGPAWTTTPSHTEKIGVPPGAARSCPLCSFAVGRFGR